VRSPSGAYRMGLRPCPKCKRDARQDCDLCARDGRSSRYVPVDVAIEWIVSHGDDDEEHKS
jgi:hypothetical protein